MNKKIVEIYYLDSLFLDKYECDTFDYTDKVLILENENPEQVVILPLNNLKKVIIINK